MRARLLVLSLLSVGAVLLHAQGGASYDLIIRNARIIDGTASPWYRGDIAVRGDTIAQIAPRIDGKAARDDRCPRAGRRARLHRHPHARAPRHLRGADRRQLRAAGRHDADRRPRRRIADSAGAVSREGGGHAHHTELRDVHRPGLGAQRSDGRGRSRRRRAAELDKMRAPRRAGHGRGRVRPELGTLLRARRRSRRPKK